MCGGFGFEVQRSGWPDVASRLSKEYLKRCPESQRFAWPMVETIHHLIAGYRDVKKKKVTCRSVNYASIICTININCYAGTGVRILTVRWLSSLRRTIYTNSFSSLVQKWKPSTSEFERLLRAIPALLAMRARRIGLKYCVTGCHLPVGL